jgi:histidinol-phosphate aminotransferase
LLTAGSDLAIKSVIQSLIEKDDEVVTFEPGYAMTEVYTKMFGGKTISLKYNKNFNVNYQKIISNLSNKTKLVVIENPSGFTGQMPDRASILKLLKLLNKKNIFLLVDEAYIFLNQIKYSFFNKIGEYSNLIISWSFSKAHGLAGMRAGCIISCEDNMKYIKNTRPLHEITSLTSNFLKLIISKDYILEDYKRKLNETKKFIFQSLDEINIRYLDTKTNFFLIYIEEPEDFRLFLFNKGILVRRSFKLKGLNNWIRICIPPYKKRRFFVNIIKLWNKN